MATALLPENEPDRLAAVRRYDILDTPPDGAFDRVTALAARFCRVPISTISIVDEDRIWFKSAVGLAGVQQIGRDPGLCASAVIHDDAYVITDAARDPRSLDNPLVCGELGLRFYVGVPLRTSDGYNLGTLNIIDREPREVSADELATLEDLAAIVVDELELRLAARRGFEVETLRAAAEFRDAVVAGISHEMRTPLAVLQGVTNLPLTVEGEEDGEEIATMLRRHVGRLSALVEQFLDFSTLANDTAVAVEPRPTDLGGLVARAVDLHADRGHIEVRTDDELPSAMADEARTVQIVSELVSNAVRHSPPGSPVTVDVRAVGGELRIDVTDRGPGVDPDVLPHVFDRDHRAPGSRGSGLGLYVAHALATAQGGRLDVASSPGRGARFSVTVPIAG